MGDRTLREAACLNLTFTHYFGYQILPLRREQEKIYPPDNRGAVRGLTCKSLSAFGGFAIEA